MTVVGPTASGVGGDKVARLCARLNQHRVLFGNAVWIACFELAPHAVQVNRVCHHGAVDEDDAHPFAVAELYRRGLRMLNAVHRPHVTAHIAGEVDLDLALGLALIRCLVVVAKIGVSQDPTTVAWLQPRSNSDWRLRRNDNGYRWPTVAHRRVLPGSSAF